jgi:lambda family phage tail tape measure protein
MATIEDFILRFKTEGTAGIKSAGDSIKNLGKDMEGLIPSGGALGNTLAGIVSKLGPIGLAAAAAAAVLGVLGGKALSLADSLGDLSDATGIGASNLLDFKQSLVNAGGGLDTFEKFASKLSVSIGEAADGNTAYKDSFRALGVNTVDVNGKLRSSEAILQDTIAALKQVADPAERARLAVSLMGKEASKIDWTKVSAGKNAVTDEQVAALNKYNDAIKQFKATLETKFLTFFGSLALDINNAFEKSEKLYESIRKSINAARGIKEPTFLPQSEVDSENQRLLGRAPAPKAPGAAGNLSKEALEGSNKRIEDANATYSLNKALQTRDEKIKIAANMAAEIAKINSDVNSNKQLSGPEGAEQRAKEISARTSGAISKSALELYNLNLKITDQIRASNLQYDHLVENFSRGNIEADHQLAIQLRGIGLGEDNLELYQQQEAVLTRSRLQVIALQQEAEKIKLTLGIDPTAEERLLKNARAIELVKEQTKKALDTNKQSVLGTQEMRNTEAAYQFALGLTNQAQLSAISAKGEMIGLTSTENEKLIQAIQLQKQLAIAQKLQEEQLKLGRKDGELVPIEPKRIAEITKQIGDFYDSQSKQTQEQIDKSREFGTGWEKAYKQYAEDANNANKQAGTYFTTFTQGFEDAIVNFVKTGKLSFKDLANTIIAEFVRIQAKQLALGLFGGKSGGGGLLSGLFGSLFGGGGATAQAGAAVLGLPAFANGGKPPVNRPSLVGERGPELFVPRSAGTIIPNGQFGGGGQISNTVVTYNIQAVDAASFKSLVASDPEFIFSVSERGRRNLPLRSRL